MDHFSATNNSVWADLIINELTRKGVKLFSISPGSRSTPLTAAVANNKEASNNSIIHYDERGAAFFALGHTRATGKPSVLICTSGTAAANYFPAVIEASMDNVPLIILTADRPIELQNCGANQTINQKELYGNYVRFFDELPCPDDKTSVTNVLDKIEKLWNNSVFPNPGPVHLNCSFREPLGPVEYDKNKYSDEIIKWQDRSDTNHSNTHQAINADLDYVSESITNSKNTLIIAGRLHNKKEQSHIIKLSDSKDTLIFADFASGLSLGSKSKNIVSNYELLFSNPSFVELLKKYDTILFFGKMFISKQLFKFIENESFTNIIHISPFPEKIDPFHKVTKQIQTDIPEFIDKLMQRLNNSKNGKLNLEILKLSETTEQIINREIENNSKLTEPGIARLITKNIIYNSCLFTASSRPIRDLDSFSDSNGSSVPIGCNRGASGIDGTIAASLGFARGQNKPMTLLIGDLAFLHDINSLALISKMHLPVTIVVVNNNGGGIFSFLPVYDNKTIFEKYFGTPHGLKFESAAKMFGCDYYNPVTIEDFVRIYSASQKNPNVTIIEITTDRKDNIEFHKYLLNQIKQN